MLPCNQSSTWGVKPRAWPDLRRYVPECPAWSGPTTTPAPSAESRQARRILVVKPWSMCAQRSLNPEPDGAKRAIRLVRRLVTIQVTPWKSSSPWQGRWLTMQESALPEAGAAPDAQAAAAPQPLSTSRAPDAAPAEAAAAEAAQQATHPLCENTPSSAALQRRLTDFFSLSSTRAKRLKTGEGSDPGSCDKGPGRQQENCPPEPGDTRQKLAEAGPGSVQRSVLSVLNAAA